MVLILGSVGFALGMLGTVVVAHIRGCREPWVRLSLTFSLVALVAIGVSSAVVVHQARQEGPLYYYKRVSAFLSPGRG